MGFRVSKGLRLAACLSLAAFTLAGCSDNDPLAELDGEWRPRCGGLAPTGLLIFRQNGERYFAIRGNTPAPVERVTVDGNTFTVTAGQSQATIIKTSSVHITATYYGHEIVLERCD